MDTTAMSTLPPPPPPPPAALVVPAGSMPRIDSDLAPDLMPDRPGWFRRWFGPMVHARTWSVTVHLLADLAMGVALFSVVVTMLSLGLGMLITVVGLPILVFTILGGRVISNIERARARALLGTRLPPFPRFDRTGSVWTQIKRALADGPGWRGLAYGLLLLPWGIATFTIAVTLWSTTLYFVTLPLWFWTLPDGADGGPLQFGDYRITGFPQVGGLMLGTFLVGVLLCALTPRIIRLVGRADGWLIRVLLSPDPTTVLAERVEQLTASRDASVESSAQELRRIERDLHDGAQQRLVALAMDLGMAKERLAADGADPATEALVVRAHDEAKMAIAELRDLVRGIHPQILSDRGLDAALSALVARSSIPVRVDVTVDQRPTPAIEAAAYFVVAEAMANMAKHSGASRASVRVEQVGTQLMIDVRDDGRGGAVEVPGGGLAGLRDRVTAVDGTLRLTSPVGGPTELHVELPCAS